MSPVSKVWCETLARGVRSLEVRHLAELPVACALVLALSGVQGSGAPWPPLVLTTAPQRAQEAARRRELCCTPLEYEALSDALLGGHCTRASAREHLERKCGPLGHRLTLEGLVGAHTRSKDGAPWKCPVTGRTLLRANVQPARATFRDLLEALGAELVEVEVFES